MLVSAAEQAGASSLRVTVLFCNWVEGVCLGNAPPSHFQRRKKAALKAEPDVLLMAGTLRQGASQFKGPQLRS